MEMMFKFQKLIMKMGGQNNDDNGIVGAILSDNKQPIDESE